MASSSSKKTDKDEELDLVRNGTKAQLLEGELAGATFYTKNIRREAKCEAEATRLQNKAVRLQNKAVKRQNEASRHRKQATEHHDYILAIRGERLKLERNSPRHSDDATCSSAFNSGNESDAHRTGAKRRRINEDGNPDQAPTKKPRKTDNQSDGGEDSGADEHADGDEDILVYEPEEESETTGEDQEDDWAIFLASL